MSGYTDARHPCVEDLVVDLALFLVVNGRRDRARNFTTDVGCQITKTTSPELSRTVPFTHEQLLRRAALLLSHSSHISTKVFKHDDG